MIFSVLQSVYKKDNPDFLSQSLQSIADNTLQPAQIILVKDGLLTPELDSVIAEWQEKLPLKVVGYEQNQGLAHALNYGLQFVETDLVARMDSDDICYLDRFEKQLKKFTEDFKQLHKFIEDFGAVRILGGEPLLNSEVSEYVKVCREIYPNSPLHVVTNAILLPKMSDEFFDTVRENNAIIWISFYPPMKDKMPALKKLLADKKVMYFIGGMIETFLKHQSLKKNNPNEIFRPCGWSQCHNLCDGKIAACYKPFVTKYFNAYYNKNLPEDGALDLYEKGLTTEKIKKFLLTPFERRSYCTPPIAAKWDTVKYPSPITDWTNDHLR